MPVASSDLSGCILVHVPAEPERREPLRAHIIDSTKFRKMSDHKIDEGLRECGKSGCPWLDPRPVQL